MNGLCRAFDIIGVMFRRLLLLVLPAVAFAGCAQSPQDATPSQNVAAGVSNRVASNAAASNAAASSGAGDSNGQGGEREVPLDDLGRTISLKKTPQRIVAIGPGATEMIFALGAGDRLVGRDSSSDYPPGKRPRGVQGVPAVGDFNGPFIESTLARRPDFIIVQGETYGRARIEDWQKKTGVPVAALSATSVDGVADGLKKIGAWIDAPVPAQNLASRLYLQRKDPRGVSAFFEVGRKPLWTAGRDTLIDDILTRAGFTNAARDVASYKQYSLETLLAKQPDYYVVTSGRLETGEDMRSALDAERVRVLAALRREPGLKGLKAVQNGRVIVVPSDWALRPGPRIYGAIQTMSEQVARLEKLAPASSPTPARSTGNRI